MVANRRVDGNGYSFVVPGDWSVVRKARTVEATAPDGPGFASVTTFRLARPYRPALFARAIGELDGVVERLARQLGGRRRLAATAMLGGRRVRTYEIEFERDGAELVDELTFVLHGTREYQLLCRRAADDGAGVCDAVRSSFRLSA